MSFTTPRLRDTLQPTTRVFVFDSSSRGSASRRRVIQGEHGNLPVMVMVLCPLLPVTLTLLSQRSDQRCLCGCAFHGLVSEYQPQDPDSEPGSNTDILPTLSLGPDSMMITVHRLCRGLLHVALVSPMPTNAAQKVDHCLCPVFRGSCMSYT